jgi:hypothetical protein
MTDCTLAIPRGRITNGVACAIVGLKRREPGSPSDFTAVRAGAELAADRQQKRNTKQRWIMYPTCYCAQLSLENAERRFRRPSPAETRA